AEPVGWTRYVPTGDRPTAARSPAGSRGPRSTRSGRDGLRRRPGEPAAGDPCENDADGRDDYADERRWAAQELAQRERPREMHVRRGGDHQEPDDDEPDAGDAADLAQRDRFLAERLVE